MLPAFGKERIAATLDTMRPEIEQALAGWYDGARLDLYMWTRNLAVSLYGHEPGRKR